VAVGAESGGGEHRGWVFVGGGVLRGVGVVVVGALCGDIGWMWVCGIRWGC
jgi:hypothetical protein